MKLRVVVTNTDTGEKFLLNRRFNSPSKEKLINHLKHYILPDLPEVMVFEPFEVKTIQEVIEHYQNPTYPCSREAKAFNNPNKKGTLVD